MSEHEMNKKETMEKIVEDFSNAVNSFSTNPKYFIDAFSRQHRTLQQSMFGVITALVGHMASDEYYTDGRNEQSKQTAEAFLEGLCGKYEKAECNYYRHAGYSDEEVEAKMVEFRKKFYENPAPYLGLSCI